MYGWDQRFPLGHQNKVGYNTLKQNHHSKLLTMCSLQTNQLLKIKATMCFTDASVALTMECHSLWSQAQIIRNRKKSDVHFDVGKDLEHLYSKEHFCKFLGFMTCIQIWMSVIRKLIRHVSDTKPHSLFSEFSFKTNIW